MCPFNRMISVGSIGYMTYVATSSWLVNGIRPNFFLWSGPKYKQKVTDYTHDLYASFVLTSMCGDSHKKTP